MKGIRCLLVLLVAAWNLALYAQVPELAIDGIGKLKLGSSPAVLSEYGYDVRQAVRIDTKKAYIKKVYKNYVGQTLYQLFPDIKSEYAYSISEATFHPDVKVFYIPNLELLPGLVCKGVLLKYLNDSLFRIEVQNPWDLEQALLLKYGVLKSEESQGVCHCTIMGHQYKKTRKTTTRIYYTDDSDIYCYASYTKGYNRDCDETLLYYWTLYSGRKKELIRLYDARRSKEMREQRDRERMERLKDL